MDLFNGKNFQTFLAPFCAKLKNEIENFSDEEIVFIDFQEWINLNAIDIIIAIS